MEMRKAAEHCIVCGGSRFAVINTCVVTKDDAVVDLSSRSFNLVKCKGCGLVFLEERPEFSGEDLEKLYSKEYFEKSYMSFYAGGKNAVQSNEPFSFRLSLIEKYKSSGKLLDIGCASGEFLKLCRDRGWDVSGVELSGYAAGLAAKNYNLNVFKGTLEEARFPDGSFDVVSAGDILEHMVDPVVFLREIKRVLKKDGIIYLAVPNFRSFHYKTMSLIAKFSHKNYFVLPHHLYHFSPRTLSRLLKNTGFQVREMVLSESMLGERGMRLALMKLIFFLGRIFRRKDRIIVIADVAGQD